MNSMEFVRICESDSFAKFELKELFKCVHEMHKAKDFETIAYWYDSSDYYRYGLWCYFCGKSDAEGMVYCTHLLGVLSKIYTRAVDRVCKNRIKGAEK